MSIMMIVIMWKNIIVTMMTMMMPTIMTMMMTTMVRCEQMARATAMERGEVTSARSGKSSKRTFFIVIVFCNHHHHHNINMIVVKILLIIKQYFILELILHLSQCAAWHTRWTRRWRVSHLIIFENHQNIYVDFLKVLWRCYLNNIMIGHLANIIISSFSSP